MGPQLQIVAKKLQNLQFYRKSKNQPEQMVPVIKASENAYQTFNLLEDSPAVIRIAAKLQGKFFSITSDFLPREIFHIAHRLKSGFGHKRCNMTSISEHLRINVFGNGSYLKSAKSLQTPDGDELDEDLLIIGEVHQPSTLYNSNSI